MAESTFETPITLPGPKATTIKQTIGTIARKVAALGDVSLERLREDARLQELALQKYRYGDTIIDLETRKTVVLPHESQDGERNPYEPLYLSIGKTVLVVVPDTTAPPGTKLTERRYRLLSFDPRYPSGYSISLVDSTHDVTTQIAKKVPKGARTDAVSMVLKGLEKEADDTYVISRQSRKTLENKEGTKMPGPLQNIFLPEEGEIHIHAPQANGKKPEAAILTISHGVMTLQQPPYRLLALPKAQK